MTIYYPYHKQEFVKSLPRIGALLCLDVGEKRIGVGVSDALGLVASPICILHRKKFSYITKEVDLLIQKFNSKRIIVGYPYEMNGEEGISCQRVRHFTHNLQKALLEKGVSVDFLFWDERLSTAEAEEAMLQGDLSRKNRKGRRDKIAASLILQGFLDYSNLKKD